METINGNVEEKGCCSSSSWPSLKVVPCGASDPFLADLCISFQQKWVLEALCACEQGCISNWSLGHFGWSYGKHQPRSPQSICMLNPEMIRVKRVAIKAYIANLKDKIYKWPGYISTILGNVFLMTCITIGIRRVQLANANTFTSSTSPGYYMVLVASKFKISIFYN